MAKNNNLTDFLKDLANKLRQQLGAPESHTINPQDFSSTIDTIAEWRLAEGDSAGYERGQTAGYNYGYETGYSYGYEYGTEYGKQVEYDSFWNAYQNNGNRASYREAFAGTCWNEETLKPKYTVVLDSSKDSRCNLYMFGYLASAAGRRIDLTEMCQKLDTTKLTAGNSMFLNANAINITLDFSNMANMDGVFNSSDSSMGCDYITLTVSNKCTSYSNTFYNHGSLKNLTFTPGSVIAANINLQWCVYLTKASITSVIGALSSTTTGTTVTFSNTAKTNAFTSDEWATLIATKTNWTIALV